MSNIRKLKPNEIECRISQCFEKGCSALLYKTARVDRAILDEVYGDKWQNDFKVIDGKMYGGIGIYNTELKEWLWRWDCGTESNTEAEKGQASDCFKRAGFKWGIGIELYSAPFIWLDIPTKKNDKGKYEPVNKYERYDVSDVDYDKNGNIDKLTIVNSKGNVLFNFGTVEKISKKSVKSAADELFPPESVNSDDDLISGLDGCADIVNLNLYFNKHKAEAKDGRAFLLAYSNRKRVLNGN